MYIFCVYGMALFWPTLQFYVCVYVSFVGRYVAPPVECYYYNTLLLCCDSLFVIVECVLYVYSKFGHHSHPQSYLCAKVHFFRDLHC